MKKEGLQSKTIYYLIVIVLIILAGIFYLLTADKSEMTMVLDQEKSADSSAGSMEVSAKSTPVVQEMIYVHLCGEVKSPEVYQVAKGSRLFEVIELAGGLSANAQEASVNMARVVQDGEKIYVQSVDEAILSVATGTSSGNKVSLNSADLTLLMTLPGVGASKAKSIIDYRQEHGQYEKLEDIMNVAGIKEAMYNKIKEYITL